ncbi:DMT family transporter [Pseudaminobacter arsenicus]|uniref:DMT family transporter n=1 Tax=Borborobacter arsenicus TaxID=1851146 RepID=A0A432VBN3_9HYPH|nr:DMT family transporter [Pseudaminobacter arsenicus]RUM99589.1 DMT family transporter [Pseudaminobacter arsenicus]
MALSHNQRGALFMVVSMAGFTTNDALIKITTADLNAGQLMFVRGLFATILITLIAWHRGALKVPRFALHPLVWLRALCEIGGTVFFIAALQHLPIANVSAVLQAVPLAVTMGAALFFGEGVGWRRWLAIIAGFIGVLIVVRPGVEGFNAYAVLVLVCVMFTALRDLVTRKLPTAIPSLFVSVSTSLAVTLGGCALIAPLGGWQPVSGENLVLLGSAAVLILFGYQFIVLSTREGDISYIAPFRYTSLLWSILLGYWIFADMPDAAMIVGSAIIVGSGLYTLYREQVVGKSMNATKSTAPGMTPDGL